MLDCQDGRALCLAKDGEKKPVRILESNFSINPGKGFGMPHFWIPAFAGMTGT